MLLFSNSDGLYNPAWITPWSIIHFLSGMLIYTILSLVFPNISLTKKFNVWMIIHTIYEVRDIYYSYTMMGKSEWYDNSIINSIGDTIFAIIGFYVANMIIKPSITVLIIQTMIQSIATYFVL